MPYRRGAPKGNANRLKHGSFGAKALAQRKLVRETIRSARAALLQARLEAFRQNRLAKPHVDKST